MAVWMKEGHNGGTPFDFWVPLAKHVVNRDRVRPGFYPPRLLRWCVCVCIEKKVLLVSCERRY